MGNVSGAYLRTLDELVIRGVARAGPACARNRYAWPRLQARRPALRLVSESRTVLESDASLIVILTPPDSHAELAHAAIREGKSVLVEKPLALSEVDGRAVIDAARAAGVWVLSAPFVQLSPTFGRLRSEVAGGVIGRVHSARAMYGNLGSDWATWYHTGGVGPLAEVGIYNLQSLTGLLGPVASVQAAGTIGIAARTIGGRAVNCSGRLDSVHVMLHHVSGAVSSVMASHAVAHYRRPALELYGDAGTAYLQGDDWDPAGIDIWRTRQGSWESLEALDATWHWTDGLREAVAALQEGRPPAGDPAHDLHLLEILDATDRALRSGGTIKTVTRFTPQIADQTVPSARTHLHDRTRPPDEQ